MPNENIVEEIKAYLEKKSIGKVEFSNILGCPHSTVSRWFNGHTSPSPAWAKIIRTIIKNKS